MKVNDSANGEVDVEMTRIVTEGNEDVFIRRRIDQEDAAEIITKDPGVAECLTELGRANPDVITILTVEGDEDFHCIVGKEVLIHFVPSSGAIEFWIERLADDE